MPSNRNRLRWPPAVERSGVQRLTRRRIYILPTRNGLLLALVLGAMLLGAMNYSNGLAYALTFLLASVAVVSILHTYANLAGLTIRAGQCRPVFQGEIALFPLAVENNAAARYALSFELENARKIVDLPAKRIQWVELPLSTSRRGWNELPRLTIASAFPLGLFRAWAYLDLDQRCLAYPQPEASGPPPPAGWGGGGGARAGKGNDDFSSLRGYRAGDSLRHIHWKALAREQGLLTKEFEGEGGDRNLWFEWGELEGLSIEARLARLCRWVLQADGQGDTYGLALPGRRIERARGITQRQLCLEALALFGTES